MAEVIVGSTLVALGAGPRISGCIACMTEVPPVAGNGLVQFPGH
jgi:hypothetical protein